MLGVSPEDISIPLGEMESRFAMAVESRLLAREAENARLCERAETAEAVGHSVERMRAVPPAAHSKGNALRR